MWDQGLTTYPRPCQSYQDGHDLQFLQHKLHLLLCGERGQDGIVAAAGQLGVVVRVLRRDELQTGVSDQVPALPTDVLWKRAGGKSAAAIAAEVWRAETTKRTWGSLAHESQYHRLRKPLASVDYKAKLANVNLPGKYNFFLGQDYLQAPARRLMSRVSISRAGWWWGAPTGQGDALLVARLPLAVLVHGAALTACLLVADILRVVLGAHLILRNYALGTRPRIACKR